jgi:hypothetical protein
MMGSIHIYVGAFKRWCRWDWCEDFLADPGKPTLVGGTWGGLILLFLIAVL